MVALVIPDYGWTLVIVKEGGAHERPPQGERLDPSKAQPNIAALERIKRKQVP